MADWTKQLARLFAQDCFLCGARGHRHLCTACAGDLPLIARACDLCGLPLASKDPSRCGRCLERPPPFRCCIAPLAYRWPIDALVHAFKDGAQLAAGRLLTGCLLTAIESRYRNQTYPAVLLPVPLHRARLGARGFNQSLLISRWLGDALNRPVNYRALVTRRRALPQKHLDAAARRRNAGDAYRLRRPLPGHVALVDDVMTTGATVAAISTLLAAHGVQTIDVWCLARTPQYGLPRC